MRDDPAITTAVEVNPPPVVTVARGERIVGAFVTADGRTTFVPALDVHRLAAMGLASLAVLTAGAVIAAARRRTPAIKSVTMGHGGWISLRNAAVPIPTSTLHGGARPWWARLLGARRLVVRR